jgi:hypothetical protein
VVARILMGTLLTLSTLNAIDQAAIHLAAVRGPELAYGALKLLVAAIGGVALWRVLTAPRTALRWLVAWALAVAVLAGAAPVIFGHAPLLTGLLSGGGSLAALAAGCWWWARIMRAGDGAAAPRR